MKDGGWRTQNSELKIQNCVEVAAGLIFRDGKLLITRRPAGGHLAGLWEFPGGKREPGETWSGCLVRELREELGIEVKVGRCVERIAHAYPEKRVTLRFYQCRWLRHEPRALGCPAFKWVDAAGLARHRFPEADARLVARLRRSPRWWVSLTTKHTKHTKTGLQGQGVVSPPRREGIPQSEPRPGKLGK